MHHHRTGGTISHLIYANDVAGADNQYTAGVKKKTSTALKINHLLENLEQEDSD